MKLFELFGVIDIDDNGADEKIKDTDESAKGLGETFKGIGGKVATAGKFIGLTTTALVGGFSTLTAKVSESTDRIDKMSQNIGFSTDSFQEWDFILSQTGAEMDTVTGGIAALTEKAVDAMNGGEGNAEAFAKLNLSLTDLQGLSQEEIFEKTIQGLQQMTNETERAALASELMGGAGEELGALLNLTSEDIANMKDQANELGLVLGEDIVKAGVEMTDSIDQMKRTLMSTLMQAVGPMIPAVMELLDTFVEIVPPLMEFITPLIEKLVPVVVEIIERLLPPFGRLLEALIPILMPLIDVFVILLDAGLLPLIEALIPLIEVLLPPLAALLELLVPIVEAVAKVLGFVLVTAVDNITDKISGFIQMIKDGVQQLKDFGKAAKEAVGNTVGKVGDFFGGIGETVGNILPSFDVGTSFVPQDMIAQIHKGERIMTAEENKAFSAGAMGMTININANNLVGRNAGEELGELLTDVLVEKGVFE